MIIISRDLVQSLEYAEVSSWSSFLSGLQTGDYTTNLTQFGNSYALKALGVRSQLMNRTKDFSSADLGYFDAILDHYRETKTTFAFDIVPDLIDSNEIYTKLLEVGAKPVIHYTQHIFDLHNPIPDHELQCTVIEVESLDEFADTFVRGFGMDRERQQRVKHLQELGWSHPNLQKYLILYDNQTVATGVLHCSKEKIAVLSGGTTVPEFRGRGFQQAMIHHRLLQAKQQGMNYAISDAIAGSTSSRNLQRQGFQIAYTRTFWQVSFD